MENEDKEHLHNEALLPASPIKPYAPSILSFSFKGRYGRLNLINANMVSSLIFTIASYFVLGILITSESVGSIGAIFAAVIAIIFCVVCIVYDIRIIVLRLHDMDKSGILLIPIIAILTVIILMAGILPEGSLSTTLLALVFVLGALALLIILLCIPGTKGPNQYGEQPEQGSYAGLIITIAATLLGMCAQLVLA